MKLAFNTSEAAQAVGLSEDFIKKAIRAGDLRAKRTSRKPNGDPSGNYSISAEALTAWWETLPDA